MSKQFDQKRFEQLQFLRQDGLLTDEQKFELGNLATEKLFDLISNDPEVLAVFKRLKDR